MKIFDECRRSDDRCGLFHEPHFHYLNSSSRDDAATIRDTMEHWFANYPLSQRQDLRGRLRNKNNQQFASAFFELLLHQMFLHLGFEVHIHPEVSGKPTRPDFLVFQDRIAQFYLEAFVPHDSSNWENVPLVNKVHDELNKINSPFFLLLCTYSGRPTEMCQMSVVRREIEDWLARLSPEAVANQIATAADQTRVQLPVHEVDIKGMVVKFEAWPRPKSADRNLGARPICRWTDGLVKSVDTKSAIRKVIEEKVRKYGCLEYPLVIAMNDLNLFSGIDQTVDALFGSIQIEATSLPTGEIHRRYTRAKDGIWKPTKHAALSALMLFSTVSPWNLNGHPTLIHLPFCQHPLTAQLPIRRTSYREVAGQGVPVGDENEVAKSLKEILNLRHSWPN